MTFFQIGSLFFIVAVLLDILMPLILSPFYKEYDSKKMSISVLGNLNSPVRWPFRFYMFFVGFLLILGLPSYYMKFNDISLIFTVFVCVNQFIYALGACIITSFFSVSFEKNTGTLASKIHGAGSVIGFMLFAFNPLWIGITLLMDYHYCIGIISIVSFVVSLIFFVLFVMSDKEKFRKTFISNEGIWQRANLFFMYLPLIVLSFFILFNKY